jgi:type II secretory ATPase GspE/PulE/Tfp pilus assembly ATPase PilB-like protein
MEVLVVDNAIRQVILQNGTAADLVNKAVAGGMKTLRMVGLERVKEGVSSLEEVLSVTGGE